MATQGPGAENQFVPMSVTPVGVLSDGARAAPLHPIASAIRINICKTPGKPLDPWLNAYCEFLLSKDAQRVNGSPQIRQVAFRPLHPGEAEIELMKL